MIIELKADKINDIATAQVLAWRKAFEGILSEKLLSNLVIEEFVENWKWIILDKERKNFIWLNELQEGLGFISFGKPKDKNEPADFEIYGIYIHPIHWGKGIGHKLMTYALNSIKELKPSAKVVLWTMKMNKVSHKFYCRQGFNTNGENRVSIRSNETFKEIQFEYKNENPI